MKSLDFNEKQTVSYCIPTELRDEQIKINLTKVSGRLEPNKTINESSIALVSFGPSLNDTWKELKNFKYIMTCSGAHKFLIEKGIVPTWHVDLEPREHKVKMLGSPHKDVEYLIASTVHPKYLDQLDGYIVKLWHIFANEGEEARVLPRGEWAVCGGSSVGLRCMTLARFLGFTNLHIFGMDGSVLPSQSHTSDHPNSPKEFFETEYAGKKYLTTPSMLFCAKETFKELDQMPDVKATFYGDGIVQNMAKDYVPSPKLKSDIAFNPPTLISEEYRKLNWQLHRDNPKFGMGGAKHSNTIKELMKTLKTNSVLDYGCGKGMLAKSLDVPIWEYDPAIPEKSAYPKPADIVVCTDVLEHVELDKLPIVLSDLKRCVKKVGYLVISTRKAVKQYANGSNTHQIINGKDWWTKQLGKFFELGEVIEKEKESELHIVVGPKKEFQPDITSVTNGSVAVKFLTPNDVTKWRAKSLFTKEPDTVAWISKMKAGEVFFDVGANIGSYSVLAGAMGLRVYSFEPEAENYALLVKNLHLNNVNGNAYCVAISNNKKIGVLFGGQTGVGGACHSFDQSIDHELSERNSKFIQGCLGVTLDDLVNDGLPVPDYVKIDVDGLEHLVIEGATNILSRVKGLLVEVNDNIPQHRFMLNSLKELGFKFDQAQVDGAKRKDGVFKGVAEYIFEKKEQYGTTIISSSSIGKKIAQRILESKIHTSPYDYIYVEDIFPDSVYEEIKRMLPVDYEEIERTRGTRGYPKRFTAKVPAYIDLMLTGEVREAICHKFGTVGALSRDLLLIRDQPGYAIAPHTDSVNKVISGLFYLPDDNSLISEGTSIFTPKEVGFECPDGRHYKFEDFDKVWTAPFKRNSLFLFKRTNNSFHGVEPCQHVRDVLLYNLNRKS